MISNRTKASLGLYLSLHDIGFLRVLFDRDDITIDDRLRNASFYAPIVTDGLHSTVSNATSDQLLNLINHMIRTSSDLRSRISPRYRHDERWEDLIRCLQLDGYRVEDQQLIAFEPSIGGEPLDDDLTIELRRSGLGAFEDVLRLLDNSAQDFRSVPPDFNGCLTKARIALETLGKSIARERATTHAGTFDENRWGQVLAYLKTSGLITEMEEKGIAGVYSFISQGAHRSVGLSDTEMARLGRNFALSTCYFLIKVHNNQ